MERWTANKFGLFNFWYYDDEEFKLSNGKIIFRGTNGSGKSVTTQSFIPLLLDGDKRPSRLDPFGSNARKIENYILVNEEDEDRISYLYIEFVKPESNNYITIGMGMRGRKGKQLDSWYFILKDGRRINVDLKLYKFSGQKLPLTSKQMQNELGDGNIYTTSQKEYMEKVNEHLFGYSDIESYKDLLNLLIQLRSPKLSKDFKPTVIYEILKESLNTLSDDDLRPMAEAMDNMDNLNLRLEELKKSIEGSNKIKKIFDKYNLNALYEKVVKYKNKLTNFEKLTKSLEKSENELKDKQKNTDSEKITLKEMQNELSKAKIKESTLKGNKGFILRDEISKEEKVLNEIKAEIKTKENESNRILQTKIEKEKLTKELDNELYKKTKNFKEILDEEEYYRDESFFEHTEDLRGILDKDTEHDFKNILTSIEEYDIAVRLSYNLITKHENITSDLNLMEEKQSKQQGIVKTKENVLAESKEYLTTVKSEYIEKINEYVTGLKELNIGKEEIIEIYKQINEIYEINHCDSIRNMISIIAETIKSKVNELKLNSEIYMKKTFEEIDTINKEIDNLVNSKEVIEEEADILKVKRKLDEYLIPYEDFYKVIDFKDDLDETKRKNIEGSLLNMRILNSLIVPEEFKNKALEVLENINYRIIFSDVNCEDENIYEYFNIENGAFTDTYKEDVKRVLKSISINEGNRNNTYIKNNGFGIGIISGCSNSDYNLKYIGLNSRENYMKERIKNLEKYKNEKNKEKEIYAKNIDDLNERISILNKEKEGFPKTDDIKETIKVIGENIRNLEKEVNDLQYINEKIFGLKEEVKSIKIKLFTESEGIKIPKNKKSYEEAMKGISDYRKTINSLKNILLEIYYKHKERKQLEDYIDDIIYNLDNVNGELYRLKDKRNERINNIQGLTEAIKIFDLGKLEEEYAIVTNIITNYPEKIQEILNFIAKEETAIDFIKEKIELKRESIFEEKTQLIYFEDIVRNELNLKYIEELSDLEFNESINWIIKNSNNNIRENVDLQSLLHESFNLNKSYLIDYHPKLENIFYYDESDDDTKNEIFKDARRLDIKIKFNKKEISIYQLINYLESALEEQALLISEKEREVFEDTLINTLSSKINAKIYKAKGWVKEIDELMGNMDTSSGFKLYLNWRPKKAENEGEINVKDLTEILSTPHFMTEEQRQSVAEHFKEKLKRQKRIVNKDGLSRNYHTIIKEVLDYREWFEFQLSFSKPTERKKELTDNEFFKLSGGEKAMAMYVPLFAAVNARYNSADKKDCPRIISLDEAFAGVDEDNISNMFTLIENLKLDYILNSQVLWGTYESVKSLSIYELIRQGEDVVLPFKYHWNGKVKTMEVEV